MSSPLARGALALGAAVVSFALVLGALRAVASAPTHCPDHANGPSKAGAGHASDAPAAVPVLSRADHGR